MGLPFQPHSPPARIEHTDNLELTPEDWASLGKAGATGAGWVIIQQHEDHVHFLAWANKPGSLQSLLRNN